MEKKHYWFVRWLERYPDGMTRAYRTAVIGGTAADALAAAEANLLLYRNANPGTETMVYSVSMNSSMSGRDLLGKREAKFLPDWMAQTMWPETGADDKA